MALTQPIDEYFASLSSSTTGVSMVPGLNGTGVDVVAVAPALNLSMFNTPEAAIEEAINLGVGLQGKPGAVYTFNEGITITDSPVRFDFTGSSFIRGDNVPSTQPAIKIDHTMSASTYSAATTISAYSLEEYDYGNGPTYVPRLTLSSVAGYAVGQIVKCLSDDIIPAIAPWTDLYRYAEGGEIGAIDVGNNYVYLIRPFAETWTPKKICRYTNSPVSIVGGSFEDVDGYPTDRNAPMILIQGAVRPLVQNVHIHDTSGVQLRFFSCYEPRSINNLYERARWSLADTAYGYGESVISSTRPMQVNARGNTCRHLFDTGSADITTGALSATHPFNFGGTIEGVVLNGVGEDCYNAPFNDHADAYRTRFIGCVSRMTNRRYDNATLWGMEIRGRGSSVEGGEFEAITPVRVEPSTEIPNILTGFKAVKTMFNDTDTSRGPVVDIAGSGVIGGGRANVILKPSLMEQTNGREEMVKMVDCNVRFDGDVKYDSSLSNAVVFNLTDSKLTIDRLHADFSESTAETPMLTVLTDATSEVIALGKVHVIDSPSDTNGIVLTDFNDAAGSARWYDVVFESTINLFSTKSGWRNAASAAVKWARTFRLDLDTPSGHLDPINFSTGAGAKTISWTVGLGDECIYIPINTTVAGTYLGTIPDGEFVGQRVFLSNVGAAETFEVQTISNVTVAATRTVALGATIILRWDGTAWRA